MGEVEIGVAPRHAVQPSAASVKERIRVPGNPVLEAFLREVARTAFVAAYAQLVAPEIAEGIAFDAVHFLWGKALAEGLEDTKKFYRLAAAMGHYKGIDHWRKEERTGELVESDPSVVEASVQLSTLSDPAAELEGKELERVIAAGIAALPPARRLCFQHHLNGMSDPEIAALLGKDVQTIANEKSKARQWLRVVCDRFEAGLPQVDPPKRGRPRKRQ